MDLERTLVLVKPDGVERAIVGQIISRFENAGLKMVGLKMMAIDEAQAKKHYHDVAERHGQAIMNNMVKMLTSGPVVVMALEGIEAIAQVRKMVGPTEPKTAAPGTIRGDFAHVSIAYSDAKDLGVKNLVHASANSQDAQLELELWFPDQEFVSYQTVHEKHIFN